MIKRDDRMRCGEMKRVGRQTEATRHEMKKGQRDRGERENEKRDRGRMESRLSVERFFQEQKIEEQSK